MRAEQAETNGILSKDNAKAVWRYATRPEILPRIRGLGLHFGHFAYLIALVLNSARLIPQGHPALYSSNIGQFGVRQVLAVAANHITWSWRNIDQIAIFGAVVAGLIMMFVQAVLIAVYAFLGEAQAQNVGEFFTTPERYVQTDLVLIFLEQVFGPNLDFFGTASQPLGTPVYTGLHSILGLYSMATMVIAVVIVIYYIMTVVGEAAQTGTPFGKRFNSLWTPVRLVVALGLLVPLSSNLNSAQYITLWVAKMGSGLATKAWTTFVQDVT